MEVCDAARRPTDGGRGQEKRSGGHAIVKRPREVEEELTLLCQQKSGGWKLIRAIPAYTDRGQKYGLEIDDYHEAHPDQVWMMVLK